MKPAQLGSTKLHPPKSDMLIESILSGLGEGVLILNRHGICTNYVSKLAQVLFEENPIDRTLIQILRAKDEEAASLTEWYDFLYTFDAPFEEIASLGPKRFNHSDPRRHISLAFRPILNVEEKLEAVVMIATEVTAEIEANERAKKLLAESEMILQRYQNAPAFTRCLELINECISHLFVNPQIKIESETVESLRRELHTLKGVLGIFSLTELIDVIHEIESALAKPNDQIDLTLLHQTGAQLREAYYRFFKVYRETLGLEYDRNQSGRLVSRYKIQNFLNLLKENHVSSEVTSQFVESFCKVQLIEFLRPLKLLATKQAMRLGKKVNVDIICSEELIVEPGSIESFVDHLVHVINNSVDHGIESREDRKRANKPEVGRVEIKANLVDSDLLVSVTDDGRGLDLASIGKRKNSTETEVDNNSIFSHGFSTRKEVTKTSGRGIGLDALKVWINRNKGSIQVNSHPGSGCTFEFRLPLIRTTLRGKESS